MARLCKHGQEIGRVETVGKTFAYFANGDVLANSDGSWRIHGKVKPESTPTQAYENHKAKIVRICREKPAYAEYRHAVMQAAPVSTRWKLLAAMEVLGDDIDGIWSETCDGYRDNLHLSVEEVAEVVRLRKAAELEKEQNATAKA